MARQNKPKVVVGPQTPSNVVTAVVVAPVVSVAAPYAPTVAWTSPGSVNTPSLTVTFTGAQAGDVATVQIDTSSSFANTSNTTDTLDTGSVAANSVNVTLSPLTAGTYYVRAKLTRSGVDSPWSTTVTMTITASTSDTTPNAFSFTAVTNAATSTVYTSASITVSGIDTPSPITITGGSYAINGGAYTTSPGTVNNGDLVTVRATSSGAASTAVNATLTIGGVTGTFTVTTAAASGAVTSTFDPAKKTSAATLSPDNLTVTSGGGNGSVLSTTSKTTEKAVWEVTTATATNAYGAALGLANSATAYETDYLGQSAGSLGIFDTGAALDVYAAGSEVATPAGLAFAALGSVTQFAANFTTQMLWVRMKPPGGSFSAWNGDGTADPATGVGGISFSVITGPYFAAVCPALGVSGNAFTINFGATAFVGSIPSTFAAWG